MTPSTNTTTRQSSSSSSTSILWNPVVWCILITETAERVAYFGFRALLVLWFTEGLGYSEHAAIALCSGTQAVAYFSPLVGALLADGMWGRYRTILRFGGIYAVGLVLLTLSAYYHSNYHHRYHRYHDSVEDNDDDGDNDHNNNNNNNLGMEKLLTFIGLLLTCTGTGGIKPCVSAFGADQVVLDENEQEQEQEQPAPTIKGQVFKTHHTSGSEDESTTVSFQDDNDNDKQDDMTIINNNIITPAARDETRIREFFNAFYFCINVGAVGSFAIIPLVRAKYGFGPAFLIPTVFMVFALMLFGSQSHQYKNKERDDDMSDDENNNKNNKNGDESSSALWKTFRVCGIILRERFHKNKCVTTIMNKLGMQAPQQGHHQLVPTMSEEVDEDSYFDDDNNEDPKERGGRHKQEEQQQEQEMEIYQDAAQALHILPILFMLPIFWMLYDQQGSVWTLQASRMALHGLQPEQLNVLNPIQIMIFIPLFDQILYPWFDSHGFNIQPLRRMQYGMFLASVSFLVSGILENYIQQQQQQQHSFESVHVAWQIPQITILTVAEILLSVTGLEFAYSQAPPNAQASILALYLFMTALGDGLGAALYASVFSHCNLATAMILCALAMLVNLGFFSIVAGRWKPYRRRHEEEEKEENNHDDDDDDDQVVASSFVEMQTRVRSGNDDSYCHSSD